MDVLLSPMGSHGDVHPFVALGLALRERGHRVTLISNEHFGGLAQRVGLDFVPLGTESDFLATVANPDLWHPTKGSRLVLDSVVRIMEPLYQIITERSIPGQTIVGSQITAIGARIAQEAKGIPVVSVHLQPAVFRSAYQPPVLPLYGLVKRLPPWGRRALFQVLDRVLVDPALAPRVNRFRATLGLPPARRFLNWWHSPLAVVGLFPDWYAPPQPDWPAQTTLVGFPLFDESEHSPVDPEVEAFLSAGSPPIVFTAGSAMAHGASFFQAAVDACRILNRRGLLLARFSDQIPRDLPSDVRHFSYVPFSRLLPRSAALVHHGGIGTTAQALAAGIPQLVMPLAHDQPDNAARLERLGVGASLAPSRFQGPAVAAVLRTLLDNPTVLAKAQALSTRLGRSQALDQACDAMEAAAAAAGIRVRDETTGSAFLELAP